MASAIKKINRKPEFHTVLLPQTGYEHAGSKRPSWKKGKYMIFGKKNYSDEPDKLYKRMNATYETVDKEVYKLLDKYPNHNFVIRETW